MPWKGTLYPEPCPFAANNILEVAEDYHVAAIDAIEAGAQKQTTTFLKPGPVNIRSNELIIQEVLMRSNNKAAAVPVNNQ
ncbi:hypothetical protein Tco_0626333 [Tanacetum coccineum]|uniref:Uncharacterized protein n=1 Tax=Tanacetum coccineum TaxID=301880 RepID=A0ABQ4WJC8_9ASTR